MEDGLEKQVEEKQRLVEALGRRNAKLEVELAASRAREEALWKKIELMKIEERKLEEAEERLSVQLGQLEAEYVEQGRVHKLEVDRLRSLLGAGVNAAGTSSIWEVADGRSLLAHRLETRNALKNVPVN